MAKICSQCRRRHTSRCAEMPQKLVKLALALAAVTIPGAGRGGEGRIRGCSCPRLRTQIFFFFSEVELWALSEAGGLLEF